MRLWQKNKMSAVCSLRSTACGGSPDSGHRMATFDIGSSAHCPLPTAHRPRISSSHGFTMIELIAVMLLMFIMMGMATMAFRGMVRGAGMRGAITTVRSVLMQARQHAMMNGQPVAVLLRQEDGEVGTVLTLASYGQIATAGGGVITTEDALPWTASQLAGAIVYNFDGESGELGSNNDIADMYTEFELSGFSSGEIAFELGSKRELPSSVIFDGLSGGNYQVIEFSPDGLATQAGSFELQDLTGSGGYSITVENTGLITVGGL